MPRIIWTVIVGSNGEESRVKSGCEHTVVETGDMLIRQYEDQFMKPDIEIIGIGCGLALSSYLTDQGVPHTVKECVVARIGSADIYKGPKGD